MPISCFRIEAFSPSQLYVAHHSRLCLGVQYVTETDERGMAGDKLTDSSGAVVRSMVVAVCAFSTKHRPHRVTGSDEDHGNGWDPPGLLHSSISTLSSDETSACFFTYVREDDTRESFLRRLNEIYIDGSLAVGSDGNSEIRGDRDPLAVEDMEVDPSALYIIREDYCVQLFPLEFNALTDEGSIRKASLHVNDAYDHDLQKGASAVAGNDLNPCAAVISGDDITSTAHPTDGAESPVISRSVWSAFAESYPSFARANVMSAKFSAHSHGVYALPTVGIYRDPNAPEMEARFGSFKRAAGQGPHDGGDMGPGGKLHRQV